MQDLCLVPNLQHAWHLGWQFKVAGTLGQGPPSSRFCSQLFAWLCGPHAHLSGQIFIPVFQTIMLGPHDLDKGDIPCNCITMSTTMRSWHPTSGRYLFDLFTGWSYCTCVYRSSLAVIHRSPFLFCRWTFVSRVDFIARSPTSEWHLSLSARPCTRTFAVNIQVCLSMLLCEEYEERTEIYMNADCKGQNAIGEHAAHQMSSTVAPKPFFLAFLLGFCFCCHSSWAIRERTLTLLSTALFWHHRSIHCKSLGETPYASLWVFWPAIGTPDPWHKSEDCSNSYARRSCLQCNNACLTYPCHWHGGSLQ